MSKNWLKSVVVSFYNENETAVKTKKKSGLQTLYLNYSWTLLAVCIWCSRRANAWQRNLFTIRSKLSWSYLFLKASVGTTAYLSWAINSVFPDLKTTLYSVSRTVLWSLSPNSWSWGLIHDDLSPEMMSGSGVCQGFLFCLFFLT